MRWITILLVLIMLACPAYSDTRARQKSKPKSLWSILFPSKPKPVVKTRARPKKKIVAKKAEPTATPQPQVEKPLRNSEGFFIVDTQWYANYLEQESAWGYPIPEDQDIKFSDGKYHVPPVVYRHYEDMVNTPRRVSNP